MKNKILIIFAFIVIISCPTTVHAKSKPISVSTQDELFTAIGHQILNHKTQEFYYIASDELSQQITVNQDFEQPFCDHYNPKDPLASGCYTHFAISDFRISWFTSRSRTLNIKLSYYVPADTMKEYYTEMSNLAKELRKENDFESIKAVHNYIIGRVEYDHNSLGTNYTDIEGFRENRMVCQGYSMATYVILSYMGIPVRIVTGTGGSGNKAEPHAWNIVQVDGKWYNYDATWDDEGGSKISYDYFLKGSNDFPYHNPSGIYASGDFTNMISNTSYFSPTDFRYNLLMILPKLIYPAIAVLVIFCFIKIKRRSATNKSYNAPSVGVVLNDDFPKMDFDKPTTPNPTPSIFDDYNDQNNSNNNYSYNNYNSYNDYKEEKTTTSNKTSSLSLRMDS